MSMGGTPDVPGGGAAPGDIDPGALRIAANLGDLASATAARTALGLGTFAVLNSLAHSATTGIGTDDHHAQNHTDAQHTDGPTAKYQGQFGSHLFGTPSGGVALGTANDAIGVRVVANRSLTLSILEWFAGNAGTNNYDIGVYSDGATMNKLWAKGSTAAPSANTNIAETVSPTVAIVDGTAYWFFIAANGTTINPRGTQFSFNDELLMDDGTSTVLRFATSFPLPSSFTKSSGVNHSRLYKFIGRSA